MSPPDTGSKIARGRWKLLRSALISSAKGAATAGTLSKPEGSLSVRREQLFSTEMVKARKMGNESGNTVLVRYSIKDKDLNGTAMEVELVQRDGRVTLAELATGISAKEADNTGNVCLWPCEQVLAWGFANKRSFAIDHVVDKPGIIELGCGFALAGFVCFLHPSPALPKFVHLTDGNVSAVGVALKNVDRLAPNQPRRISAATMMWGARESARYHGWAAVAADCFFFREFWDELADTVERITRGGGSFVSVAPRRAGTLEGFVKVLKKRGMSVVVEDDFDEVITSLHKRMISDREKYADYDEDLHRPVLVVVNACGKLAPGNGPSIALVLAFLALALALFFSDAIFAWYH